MRQKKKLNSFALALRRRARAATLLIALLCLPLWGLGGQAWAEKTFTLYTATAGPDGVNGDGYAKLVDNNKSTKVCATFTSGVYIDFNTLVPIIPTGYVLTTASDAGGDWDVRSPKTWKLYGKLNVDDDWTVLDDVTDGELPKANTTDKSYSINNTEAYKYFRYEITAIKGNTPLFQIAELQLNGHDTSETVFTKYTATAGSTTNFGASCGYDKLFDNNTGTKWAATFSSNKTVSTVSGEECLYVEFNTPDAIIPTGYILTTADDTKNASGRNPKSWKLYGKMNEGDAWTLLTNVENSTAMPAANKMNVEFALTNTTETYKYFRFEVSALVDNTLLIQLSELKLKGLVRASTTYTSYNVTAGSTTNFGASYGYDKLFDNNTGTKWAATFSSNATVSSVSGETCLYVEFNTPYAIIPLHYILTTGDDTQNAPGRNPKSWKLYGKLNEDDTWRLLTNVENSTAMPAANKTDVEFALTNSTEPYQYFRFEVSALVDNTLLLQLSELKLKGNDAPITTDIGEGSGGFSNQGYEKLFDGDTATKWCSNTGNMSVSSVSGQSCWYAEFSTSGAFMPTGYVLTTGDDTQNSPGRNPTHWKLYGKLNEGDAWTLLDNVENSTAMPAANKTDVEFTLSTAIGIYRYFRFEVSAVKSGNILQLSELTLTGEAWKETTYTEYTAKEGSGSPWSGYGYEKLLDNNTGSKWCTRNDYMSVSSVSGQTCWYAEFSTPNAIIASGYVLTTGDDTQNHSGRNPKDWKLYGKFKKSDQWTLLADVTDNTDMPAANKTDVSFALPDIGGPYKYFRFEVSAVKSENTLQLSELKMKGADNPIPITYNAITLAAGTPDAANWTISPAEAAEGETVTLSYTGTTYRVNSVALNTETIATNNSKQSYSGNNVNITVFATGDSDGGQTPFTISTKNGVNITRMVLTVGYYSNYAGSATASSGTCSVSGSGNGSTYITVTDINAPSVTISCLNLAIKQAIVTYCDATVDWDAATNSGTFTMPAYDVVVSADMEIPTYNAALAQNIDDAEHWTISPTKTTAGSTVSLAYTGTTHRVNSVTVMKEGEATETFETTKVVNNYTGTNVSIYAEHEGDKNGFNVHSDFATTISTTNGKNITSVVLTTGSGSVTPSNVTASPGTCTVSGNIVTITDINATSVSISSNEWGYIKVSQVDVTYPGLVPDNDVTIDWNGAENTGTFTMPAYDVVVSADMEIPTYNATFASDNDNTDWMIDPEQQIEGGTVTVSYDGPHKVKSVTVKKKVTPYEKNEYNVKSWNGTEIVSEKMTADSPTEITNSYTNPTLSGGWYTVTGDNVVLDFLYIQGDVHLILCDGATLTVNGTVNGQDYNLYIYGQGEGTGKLIVTSSISDAIDELGLLEIHGGDITATTPTDNYGNGIDADVINVYGGKLTAASYKDRGIYLEEEMNIYGGEVELSSSATDTEALECNTLTVYGGRFAASTPNYDDYCINCEVKSGTADIKFYWSSDGTSWGDGISYYQNSDWAPSDYKYVKAY